MTDATDAGNNPNATNDTSETTMTHDKTRAKRTLGEMSHTNPYTGEVFGDTQTYSRGKTVAADGGEANGVSRPSSDGTASDGGEAEAMEDADADEDDPERLEDVDHTPPGDAEGAQAAYDRGNEDE